MQLHITEIVIKTPTKERKYYSIIIANKRNFFFMTDLQATQVSMFFTVSNLDVP